MPPPISRRSALGLLTASAAAAKFSPALLAADSPKPKPDVETMVEKGLEWLRRSQHPDGHWEIQGGGHPTAMTGVAGMAMLMEGSTPREGKYSDNVFNAVKWCMGRQQSNGLLGNTRNPQEQQQYIYGHGFCLLFLASVYGQEDDADTRKKLESVIQKAVKFSGNAQTTKGGWGYVSGKEMNDFDEGSTTITQLQALRAAKNAGITVPKEIIDRATNYLRECTTSRGGVVYNHPGKGVKPQPGNERPPITAAAVACAFSSGQYNDDYAKKWLKFCKENIRIAQGNFGGEHFFFYMTYYFGQAMYVLGDDRYGELFPNDPKSGWLTWSTFKEKMFAHLKSTQQSDGSWTGDATGPVFATSANLCILQLEKNVLPIYHR